MVEIIENSDIRGGGPKKCTKKAAAKSQLLSTAVKNDLQLRVALMLYANTT